MSLDQIITVQIDRTTTTPTAAGFGTPLIAGYFPNSIFTERVVSVSSAAELITTYGFKTTDSVYIAATDMFAQNPAPPIVKIGRRALAPQQVLHVIPPTPVEGEVYTVNVQGYADSAFASRALASVEQANYTVVAGNDQEDVVDSWVTSFTGNGQDWTATKSGIGANAVLVITVDNTTMDGLLYRVAVTGGPGVKDMTADPGIATDLAAIDLYDPDWYGFCIDSNSAAEIAAAAAWVESAKKQFVAQTRDPDVANLTAAADATSIAYALESGGYERTMLFYHETPEEWPAAAMLGRALPEDAGSITWAYKQLASVTSQTGLTTTQTTNLEGKNVNTITTLAGVSVTRYGTSSAGEYMDVMRGTDWLAARIQERVYALLIQNDKLPFTDAGIQAVRSEILAQLQQGVARDFIAADPEPTCTVPRASEVSAADKGSRTLNNVTFRATLAGAIHKVAIEGELNL